MNNDSLKLEKLDYNGLQTLIKWAENEGWNPGIYDAEAFWETDPDGYYGYHIDGELIAGGSIVSYNGEFGFMGLFIVKPEYRSSGIGRKLWHQRRDLLLSRLKKDASIGMDGVIAMQDFYRKGGFEIAFRDERYENIGSAFPISTNISEISDKDMEIIQEYDKQCFGYKRTKFLQIWLKMPNSRTFIYNDAGNLRGFVTIRKAVKGYKICPLFADNELIAEELYKFCLNSLIGEPVYIDIPVINRNAVNMVRKFNTKYVFECARMYYGKAPDLNIKKVFGLTTFELG